MKLIATAVIVGVFFFAATAAQGADVIMDAADYNKDGNRFNGFAAVRPIVDNSRGVTDMTGVRFKIEIHSGTLGGIGGWDYSSPDNPWYGAKDGKDVQIVDGKKYTQGIVYYPPTHDWAPYFDVDPTPDDPDDWELNNYELFDTVPAGVRWDRCVKIIGWAGGDIELFSVAEGQLTADGANTTYFDTDSGPQTIPEPATLGLLVMGGLAVFCRKRG